VRVALAPLAVVLSLAYALTAAKSTPRRWIIPSAGVVFLAGVIATGLVAAGVGVRRPVLRRMHALADEIPACLTFDRRPGGGTRVTPAVEEVHARGECLASLTTDGEPQTALVSARDTDFFSQHECRGASATLRKVKRIVTASAAAGAGTDTRTRPSGDRNSAD
jgi:hypothetical protein